MSSILRSVFCYVLVLTGLACPVVLGQSTSSTSPEGISTLPADSLASLYRTALQHVAEANYPEARTHLETVVDVNPTFQTDEDGSAAYWLGKTHQEQGDEDAAYEVWSRGIEAADENESFDLRLADAFVRATFTQRIALNYASAADQYLEMLARMGRDESPDRQGIYDVHLRHVAPVLPQRVQEASGVQMDPMTMEIEVDLTPEASRVLTGWWRSQDPLPASRINERVHEHLRRAMYAQSNYSDDGRIDDRGKTYIRFGKPKRNVSIDFNDANFINRVTRDDPTISRWDVADNEFWTYQHVHREAQYLFVEKESDPGYYELGSATDLVPSRWATGRNVRPYIQGLEITLRQMAVHHEEYAQSYVEISNYASAMRAGALMSSELRPRSFASSIEQRVDARNRRNSAQRAKKTPRSFTQTADTAPPLAVNYRTARFLEDDGSTRLEVYWSLDSGSLTPPEGYKDSLEANYLIVNSLVREDEDHIDREVRHQRYVASSSHSTSSSILKPVTSSVTTEDSLFHIGLQWDQFSIEAFVDEQVQTGSLIRRTTSRVDSVSQLSGTGRTLEMSDLRPLTVSGSAATGFDPKDAIVYPFQTIGSDTPLALYFEVYHLGFDSDDRTRYTVEYDVIRTKDRSSIGRLFRGDGETRTSFESTYTASQRDTEEFILIDLDDIEVEEQDALTIIVRVTDEVTNQQKTREITYTYAQASPVDS